MIANPFQPARKERIYLRMALVGASGSGKTWTALTIASQLAALRGGKLAVIDTEGRSARKYADKFSFDVLDLSKNFSPAEYINAINAAVQHGYAVVLVDSFTHAWNGAGGVLEIVDKAGQKMGGNKFAGWSQGRPAQNSLQDAILNAPIDIIGTMRSKTEWALQPDPKTGKDKPVKIGMAPVQSDDFEYEFDVVGYMDMQHTMSISKSRCSELDGSTELIDSEYISAALFDWLTSGAVPTTAGECLQDTKCRDRFEALCIELGIFKKDDHAPYLAGLGNIERYAEYPGSYDAMVARMREIHATLNTSPEPPADETPAEDAPQADPEPAAAGLPKTGFVIVTEAICMTDTVEFVAPNVGKLSINRHRLMDLLEKGGGTNQRIDGRRQVEVMRLRTWGKNGNALSDSTHSFPELRLDYKVMNSALGGVVLTIETATSIKEWHREPPATINAGTPEVEDGKLLPTEEDANMEYERAMERNP